MEFLSRITNWWVGQYRGQRTFGKLVWAGAPLLFMCCGLTMLSALLNPPEPEPTAAVVDRAATIDLAQIAPTDNPPTDEPTTAPPTHTTEPTEVPPTATQRPTNTPRPTSTTPPTSTPATEPTSPPVRAATAIAATVAATQPVTLPTHTAAPTLPPSTAVPTIVPPTAAPTALPQPTTPLVAAPGDLQIIGVDKRAEVVTIRNNGAAEINLAGWTLRSEKGSQDCALGGVIGPGQTLEIWAMSEDAGRGGFNCGFGTNIWNNSEPDPAVLINPSGQEVSRW